MLVWVVGIGMLVVCGIAAVREERARRKRLDRLFEGRDALSADEFGKRYFSGAEAEIAARVRKVVQDQMAADGRRLLPDDHLTNDLEVGYPTDSMDWLELVMALESEFKIEIAGKDAAIFRNIRDVVHYLSARGVRTHRTGST
ncbi:MAG: acyl carrier protein [bacterium]